MVRTASSIQKSSPRWLGSRRFLRRPTRSTACARRLARPRWDAILMMSITAAAPITFPRSARRNSTSASRKRSDEAPWSPFPRGTGRCWRTCLGRPRRRLGRRRSRRDTRKACSMLCLNAATCSWPWFEPIRPSRESCPSNSIRQTGRKPRRRILAWSHAAFITAFASRKAAVNAASGR